MIKIGGVTIDVSHPKTFATKLEEKKIPMKYEYIFNEGFFRGEDELEWFQKRFDIKKADTIEEMVDKVDIGFIQSCNWENHLDLAMPFIKKGKPVFIDKPIVGTMKDISRIEKLVEDGAKIIGSSSVRYAKEIKNFLETPVEERGEILSLFGTAGVDEFNYCVHIVEAFSALAGCKGTSCSFVGKSTNENGHECEIYNVKFENGIVGTYYSYLNFWQPFHITIMTTKGTFSFVIDVQDIYVSLMERIYDYMANNNNTMADIYTLTNVTKIMLCGKKSRDEKSGAVVTLDELTNEDKFDGDAFYEFYRNAQGKVYKD